MSMTDTYRGIGRTKDGALMVTDLFEKKGLAPIVGRRPPYWNPPVPAALRCILDTVHVPVINWRRTWPETGTSMTDVDGNAAYLSAASSATFAHGPLEERGPIRDDEFIEPGLYLMDVHPWQFGAPGSPLGDKPLAGAQVWVTHQTARLLRDVTYGTNWCPGGHWPDATIYDSWVSRTRCRFTKWTDAMRDMRALFIDQGDEAGYEALKLGYSQAQQMWLVPPDPKGTPAAERKKKNLAYRPDWSMTLRAQHAFNMWRRAYMASLAGHPPVAVGGRGHLTDGMAFTTRDLTAVLAHPKRPIVLDATGKELGTFKMTRRYFTGQDEADE